MGKRGRPRHPDVLTPREWEVLGLVRGGLSNDAIAERLGISVDGVKYHVSEILGKLGVDNRADAARWAEEPSRPRAWSGALAPLALLQRVRLGWLSGVAGAGVAAAVVAALSVLVWTLAAGEGDGTPLAERTPGETTIPGGGAALILDRPGTDFSSVDFVSNDEGWLLAAGGLLHTTDGGDSWSETARIIGDDVSFVDESHGWIVGEQGAIYASVDGGKTWLAQESGTAVHLSDVVAVSANEAWAVGYREGYSDVITFPLPTALLHTTDGGKTWRSVPVPEHAWFNQIVFRGDTGWVVGTSCQSVRYFPDPDRTASCTGDQHGAFLHTTDAGKSWSLIETDLPDGLRSAAFTDEENGVVLGSCSSRSRSCRPGIFQTADAGATWRSVYEGGDDVSFQLVVFRSEEEGWVLGGRDLLRTTDGGDTWDDVEDVGDAFIRRMHVTDDALFLVGQDTILRSNKDGRELERLDTPAVSLGRLDFVSREVGYGASDDTLVRTSDGGATWERVGPLPGRFDFIDPDHGFASSGFGGITESGTILKTDDGGRSWKEVFHQTGMQGGEVTFVDLKNGWLLSRDAIHITGDGGESWRTIRPGTLGREFLDLTPVNGTTAWAIVSLGDQMDPKRLLLTTDGGVSWRPVKDMVWWEATTLQSLDSRHLWYTTSTYINGPSGTLSYTTDGGATWTDVTLGTFRPRDFEFVDLSNGWMSGNDCTPGLPDVICAVERDVLMRTQDGGNTWVEVPMEPVVSGDLTFVGSDGWLHTRVDARTILLRIR